MIYEFYSFHRIKQQQPIEMIIFLFKLQTINIDERLYLQHIKIKL